MKRAFAPDALEMALAPSLGMHLHGGNRTRPMLAITFGGYQASQAINNRRVRLQWSI